MKRKAFFRTCKEFCLRHEDGTINFCIFLVVCLFAVVGAIIGSFSGHPFVGLVLGVCALIVIILILYGVICIMAEMEKIKEDFKRCYKEFKDIYKEEKEKK